MNKGENEYWEQTAFFDIVNTLHDNVSILVSYWYYKK